MKKVIVKKKLFHIGICEPYCPDKYRFEFILFSMPDERYLNELNDKMNLKKRRRS